MEDQVLQAMHQHIVTWSEYSDERLWLANIQVFGAQLFGEGWGGGYALSGNYPVLSKFLGRLRAKGLVQRHGAKNWTLTEAGDVLMGNPTAACPFQAVK